MENKTQKRTTTHNGDVPAKVKIRERKSKGKTIAIVALSILLGLATIFGATAAFFTANKAATGQITLGDPVNIDITQGGASVTSLTFSGTAMPGTVYDQVIGVSVPATSSDCVVRGKLTITNTDGASVNVTASTDDSWQLGEDEYYYYKGVMSASDSTGFVNTITVPTTLTNTDANKTYTLNIQIEAIQFANGAAAEVWTTAPQDWITNYGSGTIA